MKALYSFKRLLVVLFVVALASTAILVHYNKTSTYSNEYIAYAEAQIASKQEFARTHQNLNRGINIDPDIAREMFNAIMSDDTLSRAEKEVKINEIGYYTYQEAKPTSGSQDVRISGIEIYYLSSGNWFLRNYVEWYGVSSRTAEAPTPSWPALVGERLNVGSENYAGILLTDTYGNSNGLAIVGTWQTLWEAHYTNNSFDGTWVVTETANPNRFTGITSLNGALFKYQDKMIVTDVWNLGTSYSFTFNDYQVMSDIEYNSNFANFHGNAVGVYGNTWDSSTLTSIGFGLDGSFSFGWSNNSGHWAAMSPVDTRF